MWFEWVRHMGWSFPESLDFYWSNSCILTVILDYWLQTWMFLKMIEFHSGIVDRSQIHLVHVSPGSKHSSSCPFLRPQIVHIPIGDLLEWSLPWSTDCPYAIGDLLESWPFLGPQIVHTQLKICRSCPFFGPQIVHTWLKISSWTSSVDAHSKVRTLQGNCLSRGNNINTVYNFDLHHIQMERCADPVTFF